MSTDIEVAARLLNLSADALKKKCNSNLYLDKDMVAAMSLDVYTVDANTSQAPAVSIAWAPPLVELAPLDELKPVRQTSLQVASASNAPPQALNRSVRSCEGGGVEIDADARKHKERDSAMKMLANLKLRFQQTGSSLVDHRVSDLRHITRPRAASATSTSRAGGSCFIFYFKKINSQPRCCRRGYLQASTLLHW